MKREEREVGERENRGECEEGGGEDGWEGERRERGRMGEEC